MRAEQADAAEPVIEPTRDSSDRRNHRSPGPLTAVQRAQLKIGERSPQNRVQRLLHIADILLRETETLARDKTFTDESNRLRSLNVLEGVDFYGEVKRFETGLIRLALDQTHGHQAQAAKLLGIKPTTLNSKIKLYGIEY